MTDDVLNIIEIAEEFVKEKFKNHDPSHDWHHVHRVRLMALNLSRCESLKNNKPNLLILELGALFHDLCDVKYSNSNKGIISAKSILKEFFDQFIENSILTLEQIEIIYKIVENISWSKSQARSQRFKEKNFTQSDIDQNQWELSCSEFQCISDADRLDAIGSIGIMRVSAYSSIKNKPLYIPPANSQNDPIPPAEQAEGYNNSAIAHFYEKLLKIKDDELFTQLAKIEASRRQEMMKSFLSELDLEWLIADQGAQLSLLS